MLELDRLAVKDVDIDLDASEDANKVDNNPQYTLYRAFQNVTPIVVISMNKFEYDIGRRSNFDINISTLLE